MILEFDEKSLKDVSKALKQIVRIKRNLEKESGDNRYLIDKGKKSEIFEKVFNSIDALYRSNSRELRNLYESDEHMQRFDYYVYAHCDPTDPLDAKNNPKDLFASTIGLTNRPFYIGKGVDNRCNELNRNDSHRKVRSKLLRESKDIEVVIIEGDMTVGQSLLLESKLIDIFGIISLSKYGWLTNLDEGNKYIERRRLYNKGSGKILRSNNLTA